jgi:hypothetical protein
MKILLSQASRNNDFGSVRYYTPLTKSAIQGVTDLLNQGSIYGGCGAYSRLGGKDSETGKFSEERRVTQIERLALPACWHYQPELPGSPLNGPTSSGVIQPP